MARDSDGLWHAHGQAAQDSKCLIRENVLAEAEIRLGRAKRGFGISSSSEPCERLRLIVKRRYLMPEPEICRRIFAVVSKRGDGCSSSFRPMSTLFWEKAEECADWPASTHAKQGRGNDLVESDPSTSIILTSKVSSSRLRPL